MGKAKRWIAVITAVSLAAFGGYKGLSYLKEKNTPKVKVVDVAELLTEDYDDYGYYDSSLSGNIAMNVTQNIRIDKDVIVGELLVNVGDEVKQGDLLMTIDTTLTEMELGLQDLKLQQMRQNLETASNRLWSLQHGGPIEETTADPSVSEEDTGNASGGEETVSFDNFEDEYTERGYTEGDYTEGDYTEGDYTGGDYTGGDYSGTDLSRMNTRGGAPAYLAAAMPLTGFFAQEKTVSAGDVAELMTEEDPAAGAVTEEVSGTGVDLTGSDTGITDTIEPGDGYETVSGDTVDIGIPEEELPVTDDFGTSGSAGTETVPEEGTGDLSEMFPEEMESGNELAADDSLEDELVVEDDVLTPAPSPAASPSPTPGVHPDRTPTVSELLPADYVLYEVLDYYSDPIYGEGTNENPFIYLCDSEKESIIMKGSFLNLMAGYNYYGDKVLNEEGYWFMLVFFANNEIPAPEEEDPDLSGMSFILYNGKDDFEAPYKDPEYEYEVFSYDAEPYTDQNTEEEENFDDSYIDDEYVEEDTSEPGMTRDEAIKQQEQLIKDLELGIKQGEKELLRLQKRCEIKEIRSRIDGTVSYAGNPDSGTSSMDSFLRVKSKDGYYVAGQVSEMMLDQITTGTIVTCTTDMGETFEAEVLDVSTYPDTSGSQASFSDGNPNASVYGFTATIAQTDLDINEDTWLVSVTLPQTGEEETTGITINKAFVRSENGRSYVMKEENGALVKQYVRVGKVDSYGYSITITGGLRRDDKLAFPYSEDAVEGTKTVAGTIDELYDYSDSLF